MITNNNKIAFVAEYYKDFECTSGGMKLNLLLIKELVKRGYTVDLYVKNLVNNVYNIVNEVFSIEELDNNRENYSLILSEKAIVPCDITYIHDHSFIYRNQKLFSALSLAVYKILNRKKYNKRLKDFYRIKNNLENIKKIIVSSSVLKQDFIENYGISEDKLEIIPPHVVNFPSEKIENDQFTFGMAAAGFEHKGGYITLKAIRNLKNKYKNFKVKFIYPSNNLYVKFLINLYGIKDYCEFLPLQKDMTYFYNSIDCLIMPSMIETFGMTASEAMSAGVPVISAKHCGIIDYLKDGQNGFVFEFNKNTDKNLSEAMQKMLSANKEKYNKMCKNATNSVAVMNMESFIQKYFDVINMI